MAPRDFELATFISPRDPSEASHQILNKLRGTYTYSCPIHGYSFEAWQDDGRFDNFEQGDLAQQAYGETVIYSRFPTLDAHTRPPSIRSEVSIVTNIHLHRSDGVRRTMTEIYILRLDGPPRRERFSIWRPKKPDATSSSAVAGLRAEDLVCLGSMTLTGGRIDGTGIHQRQQVCIETRRRDIEMDALEDYAQPWNLFKICLYIGPGVQANIAGKHAGFEIRRCNPYWTSIDRDAYDWSDGRVELFTPADEPTEAKWSGLPSRMASLARAGSKSEMDVEMRQDSPISSPNVI